MHMTYIHDIEYAFSIPISSIYWFGQIDIAAVYFWVKFPTNIAFIIECDLKWLFCDLKG